MSSHGGGFAAKKDSRAWSPKLQRRMIAKPVVEEFTRQRIGAAEGEEKSEYTLQPSLTLAFRPLRTQRSGALLHESW